MSTDESPKLFNLYTRDEIPMVVWRRSTLNAILAARDAGAPPMTGFHASDFPECKEWTYVKKDDFEMCYSPMDDKKMVLFILGRNGTVYVAFMRMILSNWLYRPHGTLIGMGGEFLYNSTEQHFFTLKVICPAANGSDKEQNVTNVHLAETLHKMKVGTNKIAPFDQKKWDEVSEKAMFAAWLNALQEPKNFQYFKKTLDVEFLPCSAEDMYFGARVRAAIKCGNVDCIETNKDDWRWGATCTPRRIVEYFTAAEKVENPREFIDEIAMMGLDLEKHQQAGKENKLGNMLTELMKGVANMDHAAYLEHVGDVQFDDVIEDEDEYPAKKQRA